MIKIAKDRGWFPGAFYNENFDFRVWKEHYGSELLNFDSSIVKFGEIDVNTLPDQFFIRPSKDSKTFAGFVTSKEDFSAWREKVLNIEGYKTLSNDTVVTVSSVKEILREYRLFVVDGKVITGSLYKIGDQVRYDSNVDEDVLAYTNKMISIWTPDRAFVIDIAKTNNGMKIIEINGINSAGLYAADSYKIIEVIEGMTFE